VERHDLRYRLYDEFGAETLREHQSFVGLFPPVDSRVALEHREDADEELDRLKREMRESLPAGATYAEVAAYADRETAFTALDLHARYDRADAAEITSLELDEVAGVEAALDVLDVRDPFLLVMGDSKSDLRVMEWAAERDAGIAAAPEHAAADVRSHVFDRDELVFARGQSATMLRTVYVLDLLARPAQATA